MTHAAAVSASPQVPRRRPSAPAAWERAGAASGVVGVIALVVATCILSSTPSADSTPEAVRAYLARHDTAVMASAYTIVADGVFAVFVAAKLVTTLALLPVAGLVLANAIEIAVLAAVASVASFVDRGWLAPGEPVVAVAWVLVGLWVVALAGTIGRSDRPLPEEGS